MVRRLDDYRVGEYKSSILMNFIQLLLIVVGIVCIFLMPLGFGNQVLDSTSNSLIIEKVTIVDVLRVRDYSDLKTIIGVLYVGYFIYLFINLFISLILANVGRSMYVKINKIIELIIGVACLIVTNIYLINNVDFLKVEFYLGWQSLFLVLIFVSMISFYQVKKISIYD